MIGFSFFNGISPWCWGGCVLSAGALALFMIIMGAVNGTKILVAQDGDAPDRLYRDWSRKTLKERLGKTWIALVVFFVVVVVFAVAAFAIGILT